ncbi:MAG: hypothetical protein ACTSPI_17395 [Candidatus Heimdallarchaeaceae archaeon]
MRHKENVVISNRTLDTMSYALTVNYLKAKELAESNNKPKPTKRSRKSTKKTVEVPSKKVAVSA